MNGAGGGGTAGGAGGVTRGSGGGPDRPTVRQHIWLMLGVAATVSCIMAFGFQAGRMYEGLTQLSECVKILGGTHETGK